MQRIEDQEVINRQNLTSKPKMDRANFDQLDEDTITSMERDLSDQEVKAALDCFNGRMHQAYTNANARFSERAVFHEGDNGKLAIMGELQR